MLMPRRLREQAAVNVLAATAGTPKAAGTAAIMLNWAIPMQDWTDTSLIVETKVLKKVEVTVTTVFKLFFNSLEKN